VIRSYEDTEKSVVYSWLRGEPVFFPLQISESCRRKRLDEEKAKDSLIPGKLLKGKEEFDEDVAKTEVAL
jgi:hypothetical protein